MSRARYSQVRLWGSIGFIVAVIGLGELFERFSPGAVPGDGGADPPASCSAAWGAQRGAAAARAGQGGEGGFLAQLLRPGVPAFFFLCVALMQLSHGPYYTFP